MGSGLRLRLRAPGFTLRAPGFRFWHPGFGLRAFSFKLRAAGSGPPASCAGLWTPGFVFKAERRAPNSAILRASNALRASGSELRTLGSKLRASNFGLRLRALGFGLRASGFWRQASDSRLRTLSFMFGAVRSQRRAPGSALLASAFRLGLRAPSTGLQASSYSASCSPGRVFGREPPQAECWGGGSVFSSQRSTHGQLTVNSRSTQRSTRSSFRCNPGRSVFTCACRN